MSSDSDRDKRGVSAVPPSPHINWRDNNVPESVLYGDIYYAPENGLAESQHVFLEGIGAPGIWTDRDHITIGETGFGTGLNFLATWHLWRKTAQKDSCLHYISTEKHPLHRTEITRALSPWQSLEDEIRTLLSHYPDNPLQELQGYQRFQFDEGRVTLTLCVGDCASQLSRLTSQTGCVDAWYLDGFSPAKNPDMWCDAVYQQLGRLSAPYARLATFTAAGHVRRGLTAAGFHMEKSPGYGRKRERLIGRYQPNVTSITDNINPADSNRRTTPIHAKRRYSHSEKPWFHLSSPLKSGARIAVIGAGIAGLTVAHRLKQQGFHPEVYDQHDHVMSTGSGNPAGMLDLYLTAGDSLGRKFGLRAYLYALRHYGQLAQHNKGEEIFRRCGLVKIPKDEKQADILGRVLQQNLLPPTHLQQANATHIQQAGGPETPPFDPVLYLPQAGMLFPHNIGALLSTDIPVKLKNRITMLQEMTLNSDCSDDVNLAGNNTDNENKQWQLIDDSGTVISCVDAVILTAGAEAIDLTQAEHLPVRISRGQICIIPASQSKPDQQHILSGKGYVLPPLNNNDRDMPYQVVGATYDKLPDHPRPLPTEVTKTGQTDIASRLRNIAPHIHFPPSPSAVDKETAGATIAGRTSVRAYLPDHMPICGPLPIKAAYQQAYAALIDGKKGPVYPSAPYYKGLYVMAGLSARGLTTAPLLAEILTSLIFGTPPPVEDDIVQALHPARFLIRDIRRGR